MTGESGRPDVYESPRVEELPAQDGPAVTAAGKTPPVGAEWRPSEREGYESPQVEQLPAQDGPAVTAAGKTPPDDDSGAEWRPAPPSDGPDDPAAAGA
jgi:hypothetical protein